MSYPLVTGRKGAYLQPPRYGRDQTGLYTLFTWHGTKSECLANIPGVEAAGGLWEMQESYTNARCELTARFPSQTGVTEVPENDWELFAQEAEKDILESDNSIVNAISDDQRRRIRDAINNPVPGQSPALTDANAISLYLRMLDGLRVVHVNVPILRHTQKVSNVYAIPNSLTFIGRVITTATLIGQESIPSRISLNLPNNTSSRDGLGYGWFKKFPTIRTAAQQKTHIVQEWVYGLWSYNPAIYGAFL